MGRTAGFRENGEIISACSQVDIDGQARRRLSILLSGKFDVAGALCWNTRSLVHDSRDGYETLPNTWMGFACCSIGWNDAFGQARSHRCPADERAFVRDSDR
jgi:hypothetical protein